jgi:peroxiredoxin
MKRFSLALAAFFLAAGLSAADPAAARGLAAGAAVALSALLKKGQVALVFYRSADWCPFCKKQLHYLQKNLREIEATGVQLVGISCDAPAASAAAAAKLGLTFPLLSDLAARASTRRAFATRRPRARPAACRTQPSSSSTSRA